MYPEYKQAYFEIKKALIEQNPTYGDLDFLQEALDQYYDTFDGWKRRRKCIRKGEKAFYDEHRKAFIFHQTQLMPNYGNSEYSQRDELLGTNHYGI